jgi:negative regulator of sigma E activity
MNEELDSQLSAMFDDELPGEECELLARRLSRDEPLKARWGRYAVIGAAIRSERGVRLNPPLAGRVSKVILDEPALGVAGAAQGAPRGAVRWWKPVAGAAVAAGVAAASVLWLRAQTPVAGSALTAQRAPASATGAAAPAGYAAGSAGQAVIYVVPQAATTRPVLVPSTSLANYVVAHSMVSSPVARRNLLSAFMTSESVTPAEEPQDDAQNNAQNNLP